MEQEELDKLKKAKELIQAGQYEAGRKILKAMPDNEKARQWLAKLDENIMSTQTPTTTKKTSNTTPKPAPTQPIDDMPIKPIVLKKKFNWRKWALVGVVVFAILFFIGYLIYDNGVYQVGLSSLDEAKVILADNCVLFEGDQYSESECQTYASNYLDANVRKAMTVIVCDIKGSWYFCDILKPKDVLGY